MYLEEIRPNEKIRGQSSTLILGTPGFGKSILMLLLMILELQERQGFCLIDMHGALYKKLVTWCAFNAYLDRRIILIDPSEGSFVKPLGFFRKIPGVELGVQTSSMVEAVLSIWGDQNPNSYPVMFKLLKIFFTIVVEKDMPLTQAFHLLGNRKELNIAVESLSDPYIKTIWADLKKLPHFEWSRQVTPTLNRLFRIVQSRAVQRFMCGPQENALGITFEDIILVNLGKSGNLDTDAANMFAVLLVNNLYQRALRRRGINGKDPKPYPVYIDEWLVGTPDFSRILAQTRKFGLLLTLANQDLSQIQAVFGSSFAQSILTLCQVQYCFGGINDTDASRLAREWGLTPETVKFLTPQQCVRKLPRENARVISVPHFEEPFLTEENLARFERQIAYQTSSLPVEQVDERLNRRHNEYTPTEETQDDTEDGWAIQ